MEAAGIMSVEHFLVTRFNVEFQDLPNHGLKPEWLEQRLPIFFRFCVASVLGQSATNFSWVLMMDDRTPEPYRSRLVSQLRAASDRFIALPVSPDWKGGLREHLQRQLAPSTTHVITSRVDNDDCLHRDFMASVQDRLAPCESGVLQFTRGFTYSTTTGRLKVRTAPANPFASLKEPRSPKLLTVHCDKYENLGKYAPVLHVDEPIAWLQTIHGQNLNNSERGTKVDDGREIVERDFNLSHPSGPFPDGVAK